MKSYCDSIGCVRSSGYWLRRVSNSMVLALASILVVACGGGGTGPQVQEGDTQGTVLDLIAKSTAPDSDGDGLPDDVEAYLGTDPQDRDSDRDGIPDLVEIFGTGSATPTAAIADRNGNGKIAAVDADDDGDGVIDGQQLDSDGDGIADYLEYYGFTYNPLTGKYAVWDGDFSKPYYKTDPHQKSTDQDPYDDAEEITGVHMDLSVAAPGNLPMVPAYPDIVVRLEGYSVTLNQELTWTQGASLAKGTTWDRSTETSHSNTSENSWEAGVEAEVSYSIKDGFGGKVTAHYNRGQSNSSTLGTSNSVSSGGSILSEENWSSSTTQNPVDAARIKLFLKVHNKGTAVASNLRPAFTLKIGGRNVATFVPGDQVNLLEPGGEYPAATGVYWVVDTTQSGAPLSLTLSELKALEAGAPISITLTQMAADVMLRDPSSGVYQSAGDWNEYMARVRAVSASLFLDRGDGNTVRALVYAHNGVTSPLITLGDALVWAAKGRQDRVTGEVFISYYDEVTGSVREASLAGWHFAIDGETFSANGFNATKPMPAGFDITKLRLSPGSSVIAKAPRAQVVPRVESFPSIASAVYDSATGTVTAQVSDYNGISSVEFLDKYGNVHAMKQDLPGSSFYVYTPVLDKVAFPDGYKLAGTERVRATNVNDVPTSATVTSQYTARKPPEIEFVSVDVAQRRIYAKVKSDLPLDGDPAFVRVYGSVFNPPSFGDGYCEMARVANAFEDPTGWVCNDIPAGLAISAFVGSRVVAYAGPQLFATRTIIKDDEFLHTSRSGRLRAVFRPGHNSFWGNDQWWNPVGELFDLIDLENGAVGTYSGGWISTSTVVAPPYNAWLKMGLDDENPSLYFNFSIRSQHLGEEGRDVSYNSLTRGLIKERLTAQPVDSGSPAADSPYLSRRNYCTSNDVFIYQTAGGRYGKLRIRCDAWWRGATYVSGNPVYGQIASAEYEFVTFKPE